MNDDIKLIVVIINITPKCISIIKTIIVNILLILCSKHIDSLSMKFIRNYGFTRAPFYYFKPLL